MKLLLLVNASASSVTPRVRVVIQEALQAEHDVTVAETSRRGHASRLAKGAAADGYDVVVVLGGDGTVNEAANGLAGSPTALGLLPGGSTNVFARTIGFTNDPVEADGRAAGGATAAAPLDPAHRARERQRPLFPVPRRHGLRRRSGRAGRAAGVAEALRRPPAVPVRHRGTWLRHYDRTKPHFDIVLDRAPAMRFTGVYFALCIKTNPYTFLGNRPLNVAPEAGLDSGLTIVALQTLSLPTVARVITATMTGRGGPNLAKRDERRLRSAT